MSEAAPARGLTAEELAAACGELFAWRGATVLDTAPLREPPGADDLLLVLQAAGADRRKGFVHVVPGGTRARITLTSARFPAATFARGSARDLLQKELVDARLEHVAAAAGERRCAFVFAGKGGGERRLVIELFGARGLWALLDAAGRVLVASRAVETAVRTLRTGDAYAPPPPAGERRADAPPRFAAPVLAAIDAHFTALDERAGAVREHELLARAAQGALHKARARAQGLTGQLADVGRAAALREQADLMLAYAHAVPRGAPSMRVPDPQRDGEELVIELDPAKPVIAQAQALYDKARRLDDGRAITQQRLAAAEAAVRALAPVADAFATLPAESPELASRLPSLREVLRAHGALPRAPAEPKTRPAARDDTGGENVRRFVSAEGYPILVGRDNEQNDRLTMRIANGNDLWLHVGGGRAGSHVVVRLPKQKTASLETLLDAGTLAVHFSKARGEGRIDVIYTHKKHVRKPKGLPAGAVVPSQTKTITVLLDEARLHRLLGSAPQD